MALPSTNPTDLPAVEPAPGGSLIFFINSPLILPIHRFALRVRPGRNGEKDSNE